MGLTKLKLITYRDSWYRLFHKLKTQIDWSIYYLIGEQIDEPIEKQTRFSYEFAVYFRIEKYLECLQP